MDYYFHSPKEAIINSKPKRSKWRSLCLLSTKDAPIEMRVGMLSSETNGDESLTTFQPAGSFDDFHFTVGRFIVDTFNLPILFDVNTFILRCGTLPETIAKTIMPASVQGILGNELLINRIVGYYPRRRMMVISE